MIKKLTPKMIEEAQSIVRYVVSMQSMPTDQKLGMLVCATILGKDPKKRIEPKYFLKSGLGSEICAELHAGLDAGLDAGLAGLHAGLHAGLYDGLIGLRDGLYAGLDGLSDGLHDGLYDGLDDGLHAGLSDGLTDGLDAGLDAGLDGLHAGLYDGLIGLRDGLTDGLYDGLHAGLSDGLSDGLDGLDGLSDGLHDGLYAGLYGGLTRLDTGLRDGLRDGKIEALYVGTFWSWWLCRYLIAHAWGVKLDMEKLSLLWGFCRYARILLAKVVDGKIYPFIASSPTVTFKETGFTKGEVPLPSYSLEGEVSLGQLKIFFKENRRHKEESPAMSFGEVKKWYLNGVEVQQWMAETPKEELDARKILEIKNVDQRREVLKRLGVQNLVKQLEGKIIDTDYDSKWGKRSKYELLMLDLKLDNGPAHFLKMNNLSVDEVHIEAVPRDCMTVEEAINWRRYGDKKKEWKPDELS